MPYRPRPSAYADVGEWDTENAATEKLEVDDGHKPTGVLDARGHELVWHPDPIGFLKGRKRK